MTNAPPRLLGIFRAWRLRAYGGAIALIYVLLLGFGYWHGLWPVNGHGVPIFSDFSDTWAVGHAALHGHAARVYDPAQFVAMQKRLIGAYPVYMPHWPYPPTYFLILAPIAALPYTAAFFAFETLTLAACAIVLYLIVRRQAAIALLLAAPFSAWNFLTGQSGFLTASLAGAALLALERRPVLAGVFFGVLTYKPQFGVLIPLALVAAGQWRAILGAAATTVLLVLASILFFGAAPWVVFPRELMAQAHFNLMAPADSYWGLFHTAYGTTRWLGGPAALAWTVQAATAAAAAAIVWRGWRTPTRHALKAAILSAAILLATPYALAYDMAVLAVTVAFLARDEIETGLRRAEQATLLVLFAMSFAVVPTVGRVPIGFVATVTLLALILRRTGAVSLTSGINDDSRETTAAAGD